MSLSLPEHIRDHYEDPYHHGRCDSPTHCGESRNEKCGDVVAVDVRVVENQIVEIWFDGQGCEFSQAAASIYCEQFEGRSVNDVQTMSDVNASQVVGVSAPTECILVAFRAIQKALEEPIDELSLGPTFTGPDLGDEC